ncbi:MAG: death-on-curing protein [Rhodospirillales bacterium]|nr:death-on-curing protein [Rhodospirillales bacterium]
MDVVLAIHDAQLAEHGGLPGVRDATLVQSALDRPRNLENYGTPDVADLAASYAFGLARNHGFLDGNKRTAFVVALVFLLDHGFALAASDQDAIAVMLAVAAGDVSEEALAAWLRTETVSPPR